jgi:glyoxylase-like metal-dependent hydrolase (beta-lactamase superfamily II)
VSATQRERATRVEYAIGDVTMIALSDGFLIMDDDFLGSPSHPTAAHDILADDHNQMVMPIGCFLVIGEKTVLVDLGYGPHVAGPSMSGGNLLTHLRGVGMTPADIDVVALSHLHPDHVGWLGDEHGDPIFSNAQVHFGADDWAYFVDSDRANLPLEPHIRAALETLAGQGRVTLLSSDDAITRDITRLAAPGHTPGHSVFAVASGGDRALLFGDALYCVEQMTATDWAAATDVVPELARATRERLVRSLDEGGGFALGCHFPGLVSGRGLISKADG